MFYMLWSSSSLRSSPQYLYIHIHSRSEKVTERASEDFHGQLECFSSSAFTREKVTFSLIHTCFAVDLAVSKNGRLDVMFNNAAVIHHNRTRITDVDAADFDRVLSVNLARVFLGIKHAARVMTAAAGRRGGSIINNGSVAAAVVGGVAPRAYIASQSAVAGLTRSAAAELGQHGIRVNCISSFGYATALACEFMRVKGKQIEQLIGGMANVKGPVLRAEDIAHAAVYLGSDESGFVSGYNLVIDGAFTTVNNGFGLFKQ